MEYKIISNIDHDTLSVMLALDSGFGWRVISAYGVGNYHYAVMEREKQ